MSGKAVCINVCSLSKRLTGIPRYIYEVVRRLDELCPQVGLGVEVLYSAQSRPCLPDLKNAARIEIAAAEKTPLFYVACERHAHRAGVVYCNMASGLSLGRGVLCLHDVRPLVRGLGDSRNYSIKMRLITTEIGLSARKVVTDSFFSRDEIIRLTTIPARKIEVIGLGWEHINSIVADKRVFYRYRNLVPGEYYYTLCSRAPHKNLAWIEGVARTNPGCHFAVAGMKWADGDKDDSDLPNVEYLGYVTDEESKALMEHCRAFLYPSLYEGFGIPPLEAAACGAKLVVSGAACLPEIYGDISGGGYARLIDPLDCDVDLETLLRDTPWPESYEGLLRRYSWDITARQWVHLFQEYADGRM